MNFQSLKKMYVQDLENNFIPYWENMIDKDYGGVFTCISNTGEELISKKKYIWSQGRFLWISCKLLDLKSRNLINLPYEWNFIADKTYSFLRNNAVMSNDHIVSAVEQDGSRIEEEMDNSIFADCFYILGCSAYAKLKKDKDILSHAYTIYDKITQRIANNDFQSEPYPIPKGYESHSIPMILINVAEELYSGAESIGFNKKEEIRKDIEKFRNKIVGFIENDRIIELKSDKPSSLLERHMNPGHAVESGWFLIHSMQIEDNLSLLRNIEEIVKRSLSAAWDKEYGGILRFVDKNGGPPKGHLIDDPFEKQILDTWDTKLWWPHSEALYTTLLFYKITDKTDWKIWYETLHDYVFKTFPSDDIGEWIQIRNRKGAPLEKNVALPVKDLFHIIRAYILIITLLSGVDDFENGDR